MGKKEKRKDNRGRNLRDGEGQRQDGLYYFRYTDRTGTRRTIYSKDLLNLREQEEQAVKDMMDGIIVDAHITLNDLFARYMDTKTIKESTMVNYRGLWENHVEKTLGGKRVIDIHVSDIRMLYADLAREGYSTSLIELVHTVLAPCMELAVDDNIIRSNPVKKVKTSEYGKEKKKRTALSVYQQINLLEFVRDHNVYSVYLPMLIIMIGLAVRAGELIGLTWDDVDLKKREVTIGKQLIYKDFGDGYRFHRSDPKTQAGIRVVPMTDEVYHAFIKQRELNFLRGISRDIEVEGLSGFIFTSKNGYPLMPSALNNVLYNIVNAYNKEEEDRARTERRKPELMPKFSAHVLRHTGCTRMAEQGVDIKVLSYIMGHTDAGITLDVYEHITDIERVQKETEKIKILRKKDPEDPDESASKNA